MGARSVGKGSLIGGLLAERALQGYEITFILPPRKNSERSVFNTIGEVSGDLASGNIRSLSQAKSYTLPHAPRLWIRLSNQVVSQLAAKGNLSTRGSIKEQWTSRDVSIVISGTLLGGAYRPYPLTELKHLEEIVEATSVGVRNIQLNTLGVQRIVIEDLDLPPTQGNNQSYTLRASSDNEDYGLLEDTATPDTPSVEG